ncbi:MAG: efflux RND transporter periplasmic adaptor subunit [Pseudomonadales bacterium]
MTKFLVTAIVTLILGAGLGYWFGQSGANGGSGGSASAESERKPLFYRSPMNPSVTSPVPAKDAMGMDYVAIYADAAGTDEIAGTVRVDGVVRQNIGVRTAKAELTSLSHNVRAVGRISYDEKRITQLHPKISGWVEKLFVDTTGEHVAEDAVLLSVYSPRLVASQEEYILALRNYDILENSPIETIRRGAEELVASSRARLELFDVPEHQIKELEADGRPMKALHIHSPSSGMVIRIGAREGQHVTPQTELYMIADLSRVWAYADIYEYELPWVSLGDEVEMKLVALPGRIFRGRVAYIYPYAEATTRTIKVRIEFDNPDLLLKPEMFADITILASRQDLATVIPSEAVVRSGSQDRVFVVKGLGEFEPRVVKLGLQANGSVIVLEGMQPGEEVVTSSQFLIDSESSLREATAKMMELTASGAKMNSSAPPETDKGADQAMDMDMNMDTDMNMDMDMDADQTMNMDMDADEHKQMSMDMNMPDASTSSQDEAR